MKLLWTIIALLILAAATVLLWPRLAPSPRSSPAPVLDQAAVPEDRFRASPLAKPVTESPEAATVTSPPPPTPVAGGRTAVETIADLTPAQLAERLRAEAARIAAAKKTSPEPGLDSLLGLPAQEDTAQAEPSAADEGSSLAPPADSAVVDSALADHKDVSAVVPLRSRPGEDGWTILDERFPIRGSGSASDPYEVSWELLVSASETYQPRLGKTRIPERIAMLHEKYVRVTGYVAFPIMAIEQNELLSMRNMWDGCCIGVPPTPYDAIEVKLQNGATGQDRFTAFGTLEGFFKVDPYVKGDWLLGLYLMEKASLTKTRDVEMPKPTHERLPGF